SMPVTATEVVVRLQRVPRLRFEAHRLDGPGSDAVCPPIGRKAGVTTTIRAKPPGENVAQPVSLDLDFVEELGESPSPYERLLADVLSGGPARLARLRPLADTRG